MVQQKLVSSEKTKKNNGFNPDKPQLRFKEFSEPFTDVQLGDISSNGMYGMNCAAKEFDGENKYIRITDIDENSHNFVPNPLSSPDGELDSKFLLKENDIVFARTGASTGKSYLYDKKDGKLYFAGFLIKLEINKAYAPFVYYNTLREEYNNWVSVMSVRSGQPGINLEEYKKFKIYLPSFEEQKKIASFLSAIDKKIELLEKKYENKKLIKNYYLNKILIEDFKINEQWDYKPLNEITFFQEGPGVRNYQYVSEGIKLLNVGNFVENELILDNTDRYISEYEAYGMYKHFLVEEGDLLIACSGIKAEYFDEKIAFAEKKHLPLCMNTSTMRFKSLNEDYLNLNYLKWYFQTLLFKKQIFRVLTGSAQFNFGPTHLKYLKIIIPPIEYQIKISTFFDLLKKDLDYTKKQIEEMRNFKKGLLEKMFI